MWLFFRNDDLGLAPDKFARLLALFDHYSHKLNAAVRPELIAEALGSLPQDQAKEYLQVITQESPGRTAPSDEASCLARLEQSFKNFFPCYVGSGIPPAGYRLTSTDLAGALPNFGTFLDLHAGERFDAKEIFRLLCQRNESGEEFSGVRLRHREMSEEDFATLDELFHNLYKRSIPTSFFSDFIPGFERYCDADSGHV